MSSSTRTRLPWQTVLAATVLATLAALAVIVVLGGDDDADVDASLGAESPGLTLTPAEEAPSGVEPLDVVVTRPDGTEVRLGDELDGPTVVNFFASWCPPCIAEMPDFESVSRELAGGVGFYGLAVQDRTAEAAEIVEETGVTYPWSRDVMGDVASSAQVTQMPATMFVDADGQVVTVHGGALDADELRALIESELGVSS